MQRLNAAADRLYEEAQQPQANGDPSFSTGGSAKDTVTLFRSVARDDAFLELVDHPTTFPFLWDIMGWNIQHYSEPPGPLDPTLAPSHPRPMGMRRSFTVDRVSAGTEGHGGVPREAPW